jgi:hypothetical protein
MIRNIAASLNTVPAAELGPLLPFQPIVGESQVSGALPTIWILNLRNLHIFDRMCSYFGHVLQSQGSDLILYGLNALLLILIYIKIHLYRRIDAAFVEFSLIGNLDKT